MPEDEMVAWHHRLNGHEFAWTPGDSEGQGGLACCGLCVAESGMTERLKSNITPVRPSSQTVTSRYPSAPEVSSTFSVVFLW